MCPYCLESIELIDEWHQKSICVLLFLNMIILWIVITYIVDNKLHLITIIAFVWRKFISHRYLIYLNSIICTKIKYKMYSKIFRNCGTDLFRR